ncbi:hypothetical protein PDL71_18070 [Lacibacter sp. MH-610]|uniref:hypothetical protein n=1 Tax=Lacibacter sp. MH-610 TaxID=3020883 RepID=UPI003891DF7A
MPRFFHFLLIVTILTHSACKKSDVSTDTGTNTPPTSGQGISTTASATRLSYGDTLFYNHSLPADKLVNTVSFPAGTVKYKAIPLGLNLDTVTGRINVTKSESGVRYKVFAINNAGIVLDSVKLVISGVDYRDEIFVLQSTPNAYDTSFPVYNARPGLALPCSGDDDDDDESCVFDETDLDNDGNDDIAGIIQDKLLVDKKTGTIDLEASFNAGIFGSSTPVNGTQKDFLMYYRLNDASNKALQKINIRVYYFNRRSDIPQKLLNELAQRSGQQSVVNARTEYSFSTYSSYEKPKRPPILIIVNTL